MATNDPRDLNSQQMGERYARLRNDTIGTSTQPQYVPAQIGVGGLGLGRYLDRDCAARPPYTDPEPADAQSEGPIRQQSIPDYFNSIQNSLITEARSRQQRELGPPRNTGVGTVGVNGPGVHEVEAHSAKYIRIGCWNIHIVFRQDSVTIFTPHGTTTMNYADYGKILDAMSDKDNTDGK